MLNIFRDQTRDVLARELAGVGIKAKIGERGREEEKIRSGFKWLFQGSLGVIDIEDGVVKWVNVVRLKRRDKNSPPPFIELSLGYRTIISLKVITHSSF